MGEIRATISTVRSELEEKFYFVSKFIDDIDKAHEAAKAFLKDSYSSQVKWNEEYLDVCRKRILAISRDYQGPHSDGAKVAYQARLNSHKKEIDEINKKIEVLDLNLI